MLVIYRGRVSTRFRHERILSTYAQFVHSYRQFPKTSLEVEALARVLREQGGAGKYFNYINIIA